jgi:hypothetical protein
MNTACAVTFTVDGRPVTHVTRPPRERGSSLKLTWPHVQKFGIRKLLMIAPQMLPAIEAELAGSTLRVAADVTPLRSQVLPVRQVDPEGQEKRASLQRTALGSGEQANCKTGR